MIKLLAVLVLLSFNIQAREVLSNTTKEQICVAGYTKTVRPNSTKIAKWELAHLQVGQLAKDYVVDHIVPLEVGGAPMGNNLQLQTYADSKAKDLIEHKAHRDLCAGRITLQQAQDLF